MSLKRCGAYVCASCSACGRQTEDSSAFPEALEKNMTAPLSSGKQSQHMM